MYIDPGAGSLIIQVLIAGLVSVMATVERVRHAVRDFFRSVLTRRRGA